MRALPRYHKTWSHLLRRLLPNLALAGYLVGGSGYVSAQTVVPSGAQAGDAEEAGLPLKASPLLEDRIAPVQSAQAPTFLRGDHIRGSLELETVIDGDAEMRKPGTVIRADRLEYYQPEDKAKATGHVLINRAGNVYEGPLLELKVDAFEGFFDEPSYHFLQNGAHGRASKAVFIDEKHAVITDATYTTCRRKPGPDWMPDWVLRAANISLDNDTEEGVAHGGVLRFKGVPILPVPAISFPLSDKRKSGFLPPSLGVSTVDGVETVVPYYWNIAPNRDATITPTFMSARGVDLGGEFRYLEPTYSGSIRGNYLSADTLTHSDRWGVSYVHTGTVATDMPQVGNIAVNANINRVSDDNYWRDFPSSSVTLTQRLLPSSVAANWAQGPYAMGLQVFKWQTLQDPTAPIIPPYDRVPQLTGRYALTNVNGFDWSVDADYTQFQGDPLLTLQPNAQRTFGLLQVSRPVLGPAGYLTPKLQLHASTYQFDAALSNGDRSASSVVPTFSLDSGLVFERNTLLWGQSLIQTLEPRAFYVYTPYHDQSILPNYDTGINDFNWATIFTENNFVGHDKISDNNLLTLGLATRFLDADSGAQLARFGVAQRLRFEPQFVTLTPGLAPAKVGFSDVLLAATVNMNDRWSLDSTVQYNAETEQSTRSTAGVRYSPGPYRVINAAYRTQLNVSEQVDISWQWPINNLWGDRGQNLGAGQGQGEGRYYTVGRLNYSVLDRSLVNAVLGVEYDAGCWLGRVVLDRVQTSASTATNSLMFQIEFVGFTRLGWGSSPQETLRRNISRYQSLRDSLGSSSRFSTYD